jgi:hypothetical protein
MRSQRNEGTTSALQRIRRLSRGDPTFRQTSREDRTRPFRTLGRRYRLRRSNAPPDRKADKLEYCLSSASMALIAFNWAWLTWLGWLHAKRARSRKMSATSRAGRSTRRRATSGFDPSGRGTLRKS